MSEQTGEVAARKTGADYKPTFAAVDIADLPQITREGKTAQLVDEFLEANVKAARIDDAAPNFPASIQRYRKTHPDKAKLFRYSKRGGVLYLIRLDEVAETAPVSDNGEAEGVTEGEMPEGGATVADLDS